MAGRIPKVEHLSVFFHTWVEAFGIVSLFIGAAAHDAQAGQRLELASGPDGTKMSPW